MSQETSKPELLPFSGEKIPQLLKDQPRWAPWKAVWNDKRQKYDKIPFAVDGRGLSTRHLDRWTSYERALAAYEASPGLYAGLGYLMTGTHGIVGIDLDGCVKGKTLEPWAREIVEASASYAELSPSRTGLRIFLTGTTERDWNNHDRGIEVYAGHAPRFLTVTGARLKIAADHIAQDSGLLVSLAQDYARPATTADVIDLQMPELLDESELPNVQDLDLQYQAADFLADGTVVNEDRSRTLHLTGVALYSAGLTDAQVLSILASNPHAWEVALDHRRQDPERALMYLWLEHCQKAKPKATMVTADDFEVVGTANTAGPTANAVDKDSKYRFLQAGEYVTSTRPLNWLVRGVLPKAEVGAVYGESGSGKSFFSFDLCMAVVRGEPWRGLKARAGRVAYIVAEGASGFAARIQAYGQHHGVDMSRLPIYALGAAPNLMDKTDTGELIKALKDLGELDLIVVDTMAQVTPGADENSGQDMGRALAHCKAIHRATGAMVLLVAHSGKDASRGLRGWSGIKGALDVEILVERNGQARQAVVTKMKDGTGEGAAHLFTLQTVNVGTETDEDGEQFDITSCVLNHGATQAQATKREPLRDHQKKGFEIIEAALDLGGDLGEEQAVAALDGAVTNDISKDRKRAAKRILEALVAKNYLEIVNGNVQKVA